MNKHQRKLWSYKVITQLKNKIKLSDKLYFFCGKKYREYLITILPHKSFVPLSKLGLGQQLAFYKKQLN